MVRQGNFDKRVNQKLAFTGRNKNYILDVRLPCPDEIKINNGRYDTKDIALNVWSIESHQNIQYKQACHFAWNVVRTHEFSQKPKKTIEKTKKL